MVQRFSCAARTVFSAISIFGDVVIAEIGWPAIRLGRGDIAPVGESSMISMRPSPMLRFFFGATISTVAAADALSFPPPAKRWGGLGCWLFRRNAVFAAPPTPDPSPPRAARAGGGEVAALARAILEHVEPARRPNQYKEKTPKDPTIREKFNTYRFADHKEKVIDLLMRVTRVSVETMEIVEAMKNEER
ncbi:hypothetical protein BH11PSE4_BH11PSE4_09530 [soil metagenome]